MYHGTRDISSYFDSFRTSQFGSEVQEHFNYIWQFYVGKQISLLVGENIPMLAACLIWLPK